MKMASFALVAAVSMLAGTAFAGDVLTLNGVALVDANADGVYQMDEVKVADPAITEEVFAAADTNEDGTLATDEIVAHIEIGLLKA